MTTEIPDDSTTPHPPQNVEALGNDIYRATPDFVLRMATMEVSTMRTVVVIYEGDES